MADIQNQHTQSAKRKTVKKKVAPVLKNVVSLRVSDQEKRLLERLTEATSLNVSDLVREALGFWLSKSQGGHRAARTMRHSLQADA